MLRFGKACFTGVATGCNLEAVEEFGQGKAMAFDKDKYQFQFSEMHPDTMYDGNLRLQKAKKAMAVVKDALLQEGKEPSNLSLLDVGASTGFLTRYYGKFFCRVVGIDIDVKGIDNAAKTTNEGHIKFQVADSMNMPFRDHSFDVVTCTQIYEHVPDAGKLMSEIYRVLKPGGICYFAAGNRLMIMEPHYHLPFLSVIPKWMAHYYVRFAGKGDYYYETHYSLWGLRSLVKKFRVFDYTRSIIQYPEKYCATEMIRPDTLKQKVYLAILKLAYWGCPTYIWILKKPD